MKNYQVALVAILVISGCNNKQTIVMPASTSPAIKDSDVTQMGRIKMPKPDTPEKSEK